MLIILSFSISLDFFFLFIFIFVFIFNLCSLIKIEFTLISCLLPKPCYHWLITLIKHRKREASIFKHVHTMLMNFISFFLNWVPFSSIILKLIGFYCFCSPTFYLISFIKKILPHSICFIFYVFASNIFNQYLHKLHLLCPYVI